MVAAVDSSLAALDLSVLLAPVADSVVDEEDEEITEADGEEVADGNVAETKLAVYQNRSKCTKTS